MSNDTNQHEGPNKSDVTSRTTKRPLHHQYPEQAELDLACGDLPVGTDYRDEEAVNDDFDDYCIALYKLGIDY